MKMYNTSDISQGVSFIGCLLWAAKSGARTTCGSSKNFLGNFDLCCSLLSVFVDGI